MIRNAWFLAAVLMMTCSTGHSQTAAQKKSDSAEIEMTFANGSVIRMELLPENIEINTEYGKLSVPAREIRRIEFGLHLPEGADKKIEIAVKRLGSADFKQREDALRDLVAMGAIAYPSLLKAAKSVDPETAKRALDAVAKIRTKVPAKDLRLGEEDKVVTSRFTIVGRIATRSIKAKSEYFSETELSLATLRSLRVLADSYEAELSIDAAKHSAPNQWLDTGIAIKGNRTLAITANGEVDLRPTQPGTHVCGPKGHTGLKPAGGFGKVKKDGTAPVQSFAGTLIGRVGETGESFIIGDRFEGFPGEGRLYLVIVSSPSDNAATGSYQVKISVKD